MDSVRSWLDADDVRRMAQRLVSGRGSECLPAAATPFGDDFEGFADGVPQQSAVEAAAPVAAEPATPSSDASPAQLVEAPAPSAGPPALPTDRHGEAGLAPDEAAPPEPDTEPVAEHDPVGVQGPPRIVEAGDLGEAATGIEAETETMPGSPDVPVELERSAEVAGPVVEARPPEPPRGPFLQRVQRFREWLREQFAVRGMFLLDQEGVAIFDDGVNVKLQSLARNLAQASRLSTGAGSNIHVKIEADAILEVIPVDTHYGLLVLGAVVPQAVPARGVALIIDGLRRTATPPSSQAPQAAPAPPEDENAGNPAEPPTEAS